MTFSTLRNISLQLFFLVGQAKGYANKEWGIAVTLPDTNAGFNGDEILGLGTGNQLCGSCWDASGAPKPECTSGAAVPSDTTQWDYEPCLGGLVRWGSSIHDGVWRKVRSCLHGVDQSMSCPDKMSAYSGEILDINGVATPVNFGDDKNCFRRCHANGNTHFDACGHELWVMAEKILPQNFTAFQSAYNEYDNAYQSMVSAAVDASVVSDATSERTTAYASLSTAIADFFAGAGDADSVESAKNELNSKIEAVANVTALLNEYHLAEHEARMKLVDLEAARLMYRDALIYEKWARDYACALYYNTKEWIEAYANKPAIQYVDNNQTNIYESNNQTLAVDMLKDEIKASLQAESDLRAAWLKQFNDFLDEEEELLSARLATRNAALTKYLIVGNVYVTVMGVRSTSIPSEQESSFPCYGKPATHVCREAQGDCDVPDYCDGYSAHCPTDHVATNTTMCRAADTTPENCDLDAFCDGITKSCPNNPPVQDNRVCQTATQPCEQDAKCNTIDTFCPITTAVNPNTMICRNATLPCHEDAWCDGVNMSCGANPLVLDNRVCQSATEPCEQDAVCNGIDTFCPSTTAVAANTTICRPATGPCDVAEMCNGNSTDCPEDAFLDSTDSCTGACSGTQGFCEGADELCYITGAPVDSNDCPATTTTSSSESSSGGSSRSLFTGGLIASADSRLLQATSADSRPLQATISDSRPLPATNADSRRLQVPLESDSRPVQATSRVLSQAASPDEGDVQIKELKFRIRQALEKVLKIDTAKDAVHVTDITQAGPDNYAVYYEIRLANDGDVKRIAPAVGGAGKAIFEKAFAGSLAMELGTPNRDTTLGNAIVRNVSAQSMQVRSSAQTERTPQASSVLSSSLSISASQMKHGYRNGMILVVAGAILGMILVVDHW